MYHYFGCLKRNDYLRLHIIVSLHGIIQKLHVETTKYHVELLHRATTEHAQIIWKIKNKLHNRAETTQSQALYSMTE